MNFVEFIGLMIIILAMFFLVIRRAWDERGKRKDPEPKFFEKEEKEREETLRNFLQSLHIDAKEEKIAAEETEPLLPPAQVVEKNKDDIITNDFFLKSDKGAYGIIETSQEPSRVQTMLSGLKDPKDMVVCHALLGKPKAFQISDHADEII